MGFSQGVHDKFGLKPDGGLEHQHTIGFFPYVCGAVQFPNQKQKPGIMSRGLNKYCPFDDCEGSVKFLCARTLLIHPIGKNGTRSQAELWFGWAGGCDS